MPRVAARTVSHQIAPIEWRPTRVMRGTSTRRTGCSSRPTLLWIDDYKLGLELYRAMFEGLGFKVLTATSGEEGVKLATMHVVDIVVTDYEMAGMNGEGVAAAIKSLHPEVPVVFFSGTTFVPARALRNADAFCDKAGSRNQLTSTIQRLLQKKRNHALQPPAASRASDEGRRTVA